jgi:hypothetical protein
MQPKLWEETDPPCAFPVDSNELNPPDKLFPPLLLLLELLPTRPVVGPVASNLVLEWVASIVVLLIVVGAIVAAAS